VTVFLELFVLAAVCYVALVTRTHVRRYLRRRELRRSWRRPPSRTPRPPSRTPRPPSPTPAGGI